MQRDPNARPTAIVLGSAELASAIAVRLHDAGLGVVACDAIDPLGIRRGISFTDAWYLGRAWVGETQATFCASVRSIPTALAVGIAATTWSWLGVARVLHALAVIDARDGSPAEPPDLRARALPGMLTIGARPGYAAGENAHVVASPASLGPVTLAESAAEYDAFHVVEVACTEGRFATHRAIGEFVLRGEPVGVVGGKEVCAPSSGVLSGLAARGARLTPDLPVVEVDTRGQPAACFAVPAWCDAVAGRVCELVADHVLGGGLQLRRRGERDPGATPVRVPRAWLRRAGEAAKRGFFEA